MVNINPKIAHYLEHEDSVPLIEINGTRWYHITEEESILLKEFIAELDRIPEDVWRKYTESTILDYSYKGNLAERIVRNCVIRRTKNV